MSQPFMRHHDTKSLKGAQIIKFISKPQNKRCFEAWWCQKTWWRFSAKTPGDVHLCSLFSKASGDGHARRVTRNPSPCFSNLPGKHPVSKSASLLCSQPSAYSCYSLCAPVPRCLYRHHASLACLWGCQRQQHRSLHSTAAAVPYIYSFSASTRSVNLSLKGIRSVWHVLCLINPCQLLGAIVLLSHDRMARTFAPVFFSKQKLGWLTTLSCLQPFFFFSPLYFSSFFYNCLCWHSSISYNCTEVSFSQGPKMWH